MKRKRKKKSQNKISKAEKELKKYLSNKKFKVKPQFAIDKKKYDLLVDDKYIIEYNGDYWHCNPKKYKKNYFHKNKNMTAEEIWKYDEEKKDLALKNGYEYIIIWEGDYKSNKDKELKKLLNKIKIK